ncbi:MAG: TonB family protein [Candidatus Sulfotelmatobacter sp.]
MGYQALLFCPDEKTARTVTQVLSELDFEVVSCTEPFGAVKKLMGEHFDAVVVDCDNEQNATLLFKSARNAPNNQSALAVAVVEGQAGVAKAFRIGANLVLTKPINVEQAKGTLRVARGLLRKNESAKPSAASTPATAKPVTPAPVSAPGKPVLVPSISTTPSASAVSPLVPPSVPLQKPIAPPSFAASASSVRPESEESTGEVAATKIVESTAEPKLEVTSSKKETSAASSAGLAVVASSGAASAAAPAREAKANVAAPDKPSTVISEAETPIEKGAVSLESSAVEASASPAPSFTFGGAVEAGTKSASGGSKKGVLAVAAVVLIAVAGYFGWTQLAHPSGAVPTSAPVAARPVPAPVQQAAPSAVVTTPEPAVSSAVTSSATPEKATATVAAQPGTGKTSSPAQTHKSKANAEADSAKNTATVVAENKAPAAAEVSQPIVVKKGTAQTVPGQSSLTSDAPAPNITAVAAAGNGLPNLLGNSSAPAPVLQTLSISQGVSRGLLIKNTPPTYPANALRMRVEGSVQLLATVSKNGDISAVKILSGDANLARAAADAVKQWKYKPYLLDGNPVEIQTQVTVNFKLPR